MERAVVRDPEVMHGTPVFRGTRVPVQTLFDYLENGDSLDDFLEGFPTISRELAGHDCQTAAYARAVSAETLSASSSRLRKAVEAPSPCNAEVGP